MKKLAFVTGALFLFGLLSMATVLPNAQAKSKVDCDAVMAALNGGKKAKEIAKEMHVSKSSVYRCKRKAKKAAAAAGSSDGASSEPAPTPAAPPKP